MKNVLRILRVLLVVIVVALPGVQMAYARIRPDNMDFQNQFQADEQENKPTADFGDAPDSDNQAGSPMTAYPGVTAMFPVVFGRSGSAGPRHENATVSFYLGDGFSGEQGADTGLDTDLDGINNLNPPSDLANRDGRDDGLVLPEHFQHCEKVMVEFLVTLENATNSPIYFNLWADWDRDGAWGGSSPMACPSGHNSSEWAVQNQVLDLTDPGRYRLRTTAFNPWCHDCSADTWLRATLSDQPAPADDGSGPVGGYLFGETEDYLFHPTFRLFLPILHGNGGAPPPSPEPNTSIDYAELPLVQLTLPQVPEAKPAIVTTDSLAVLVENTARQDMLYEIEVLAYANGQEYRLAYPPRPLQAKGVYTDGIDLSTLSIEFEGLRSPGLLVLNARFWPDDGSTPDWKSPTSTPSYYLFHGVEGSPSSMVIYDEKGAKEQFSTLDFYKNQAMSSKIAEFMQLVPDLPDLNSLVVYDADDPIVTRPHTGPEDTDPNAFLSQTLAPDSPDVNYTVCPEWYVNVLDSHPDEDFNNNMTGWRARGAYVTIGAIYNSTWYHIYTGYLDPLGCASFNFPYAPANLIISFHGWARLVSGSGYITMFYYDTEESNNPTTAMTVVNSALPGVTYRPWVYLWDGFGVLSFAIQARFNGGVSDEFFRLYSDTCPIEDDDGDVVHSSCSTTFGGSPAIFLDDAGTLGWRRKFIAAHEWGHKVLSFAATYYSNCSYGGPLHGMNTIEYGNCAAMEGWAHFVSASVWNLGEESDDPNPEAVLIYWDGASTPYDVEHLDYDTGVCLASYSVFPFMCDYYGKEVDWMRHWWDFHTNNLGFNNGFVPSHAWLFELVDLTDFLGFPYKMSARFQAQMSGGMLERWIEFSCQYANGIDTNTVC